MYHSADSISISFKSRKLSRMGKSRNARKSKQGQLESFAESETQMPSTADVHAVPRCQENIISEPKHKSPNGKKAEAVGKDVNKTAPNSVDGANRNRSSKNHNVSDNDSFGVSMDCVPRPVLSGKKYATWLSRMEEWFAASDVTDESKQCHFVRLGLPSAVYHTLGNIAKDTN